MKIFEVISLQEANWEQMKGADFIPAVQLKGKDKIPFTQVNVAGTDAENLKIDGMPIKGKLFVMGEWMNWEMMKKASHFYLKMPNGGLLRVDDKNFSTSVVNAMNMANQPSGRLDRIKDKAADFFDPNAADRDGYNALQRKNAAQDKASVAVTRAGAKLDKWTGLDGTGRGVGGMAKKVWNKLTGKGPKKPVSPDYTPQPGNKNFQVGQQVQWKASEFDKPSFGKPNQIVTSKIVGLEGQTYTDKTGQQQTVAKGNALFLTKNGAIHFQKPISLLTAV
jgi:hypothetical protein